MIIPKISNELIDRSFVQFSSLWIRPKIETMSHRLDVADITYKADTSKVPVCKVLQKF